VSKSAFPSGRCPLPETLRQQLQATQPGFAHGVLHFGDPRVAACLPAGGLALGTLHAIVAEGADGSSATAATGFAACLLARLASRWPVFWISPWPDLYAPGLSDWGFDPARLLCVQTPDDTATLAAMEIVLRNSTAAAVLGELGATLPDLPARRLQLACRRHGGTGFVLQRPPRREKAPRQETATVATRWEVAPAPSAAAHHEPGPARWRVRLRLARGGREGAWIMEAATQDAAFPLRVVAELADPALAPQRHRLAG
jgi:protein ImuA